ncbi:DUF6090 family protein [Aquimarina hainanensis]|uniref:DUF6090 family protein n=1 Tax=Aquimarina hainanensis TaxID=1578017 RepID=A0ABW5NE55_9FLAO|nr:DUF6090 family protein [Aquimarina sp. TRL1]QKX06793.1 hypothetical protein HN014_18350 [Aquimarina sp. TRL1]
MGKIKKKDIYAYLIEIVIIVIGVLIAFYLTNWGEEIKERKTEKEIIAQIYFELNDNLADLKNDVEIHKNALSSQLKVQEFINTDTITSDSLLMDFYWITREEYIFPNTSAFENLKNTGMRIIKNDSLRDLITLVYNNYFPRISKGNNLNPDINEYLIPYFKKNFKVNRNAEITYDLYLGDSLKITYPRDFGNGIKQIIGYIPLDENSLKKDEEFRFLISEVLWYRIYKVRYYQIAIINVKKILKLIEDKYPKAIASKQ